MSLLPIIDYDEGIRILAKLALNRELVPFFGAGFTRGCPTKSSRMVPDSKGAEETMKKLILSVPSPFCEEDLSDMSFFEISDLLFEYVPSEKRAEYFEEYYTGVSLFPPQIDFLKKINWPYAYTINVDDGIENNSDFRAILPYHKIRRPRTSQKLLYKIHGDALFESSYVDNDQQNIVFSRSQYLQAITEEKNADIYGALLSDYSQRNLLFIGCSLQDESDLKFINGKSAPFRQDTYRIALRSQVPSVSEQQRLKQHGVNHLIIVSNYESFYCDFVAEYERQAGEVRSLVYEHINPRVISINDKTLSLELLAGTDIFSSEKNAFMRGAFHIARTAVNQIIQELSENSYVLLKGRRFSGKTHVLCCVADFYRTKDVFYFPSTSFVDEDVLQGIFDSQKDSLFLFDSNSITPDEYALLIKYAPQLKKNNNLMVIAANTNDNHLLSILKCNAVELSNNWDDNEIALSSKAFDSFGLIRRKKIQTNIDYLYSLTENQNIQIPFIRNSKLRFTANERTALIALAALDKLYYSDLVALGISRIELEALCRKIAPIVELTPTTRDEVTRHSSSKLVHNSKIALIDLLSRFPTRDITSSIITIVQRFRPDYTRRRLYIEVILFDTINQLFSRHSDSKSLVYAIYSVLQPYLKNDLHYWLQRAKSIYRTTNAVESLEDAYQYAKKAYLDGTNSLVIKAALTVSLISCALSEKHTSGEKLGYCEEAVVLAYEAVFSEHFRIHPAYLETELPIGQNTHSERRIVEACNTVIHYSSNESIIQKAEEILARFEDLRCINKAKKKKS